MGKPPLTATSVTPSPRAGTLVQVVGWLGLFLSGVTMLALWDTPIANTSAFEPILLLVQGILLMIAGAHIRRGSRRSFSVFLASFVIFSLIIAYRCIYVFPELFSTAPPAQRIGLALGIYTFIFLAVSFYIFIFFTLWRSQKGLTAPTEVN